jgi:carboxypeptidase Taq
MSYAALAEHYRQLYRLRHIESVVGWDEATVMPTGAGRARAEALSSLRGLIHREATRPELADLLSAAEADVHNLDPWQRANLREMRREWRYAAALPSALVRAMSQAESECEQAWRALRPANDFAGLLPSLREVLRLKREGAQAWAAQLSLDPYDALLDNMDPGARVALIAPLFSRLRAFLPAFIQRVVDRQANESVAVQAGPFSEERQHWLGLLLMKRLGFDFQHGRLDTSHHPFCSGPSEDTRITTRYQSSDFTRSMMSVLHETGHAKYQQNLPHAWRDQPVGAPRGMSIHESQSLLLEMQVCRSRAFLSFAAPFVTEAFSQAGTLREELSPDNLHRQLTRVKPSLIRVDADEVTYPCHIALRFDLERKLIDGSLRLEEVPEMWDAGMRELLGLSTRGNDRDGCMQDVHWPAGLFGYFPGYTLGALTAAQLFHAVLLAHPDLPDQIRKGDFSTLDGWLREHVWGRGSFLEIPALIEQATGSPLGTAAFEEHLDRRYLQRDW